MGSNSYKRVFGAIAVCLLLFAAVCHGQITTATVTGTITDSSGAAVAGATVTLANSATNVFSKSISTDTGLYRIPGLIPGVYRVTVAKIGFKGIVKDNVELHIEDQVSLNFSLQVGSVTESVTVEAGQPLVDTESTSLGEVIEGRQVEEAPLNGRNVMNLVGLVPGVVPQGTSTGSAASNQSSGSVNPAGFGNYQIAGGIAGWNATFVDGGNVNASGQNWQALVPTQDSIGEFKVDTNAVTPQYGRFAGGVINFSTKSGGNAFHGNTYEYVRNTVFDANTFFSNLNGAPRGVLHQNQFGATLGGPIIRDKSFFFFSWESTRLVTAQTFQARVPTAAEMSGDFRADGYTFDAKTGAQANCNGVLNTICSSELDPTAAAMFAMNYWAPVESNATKLGILEAQGYNAEGLNKQPNNAKQYVGRVDHQLTSKNRLFGRYTYWNIDIPQPSGELPMPAIPVVAGESFKTHQVVLGDNDMISNTINADFRVAFYQFLFDVGVPGAGKFDMAALGSNWAAVSAQLPLVAPPTFFPGTSWFGMPYSIDLQQHNHNDNYSASATISQVEGRHAFMYGGEARRVEYYSLSSIYPSGNFAFYGTSPIANYVEGVTTNIPGLTELNIASAPSAYSFYQGYYITDTFKASSKLTLNLGVRWELPGAWYEKHDSASVLLPDASNPLGTITNPAGGPTQLKGIIAAVNSPDYKSRSQSQIHWHLFEPRLGVNYAVFPQTVLRLGFGITHPCLDCGSSSTEVGGSPFSSAVTPNQGPTGSLSDPYPNGILQPLRRTLKSMEPLSEFPQTLLGAVVGGVEPFQKFPYVLQWNANVERSLGSSTSVLLSYVGSRGLHLGSNNVNLNQLPDQYDSLGAKLLTTVNNPLYGIAQPSGNVGGKTATYGQFLLPYPEFTQVNSYGKYRGESIYHGVIVEAKKRFAAGATMDVNYTWAHLITTLDSQNGYLEPGQSQTGYGPQDYTNPKADRSNSAADIRQRVVVSYILDMPFGKGKRYLSTVSGVVNQFIGGWGLSGITTFQAGLPIGFTTNTGNYLQTYFGAGTTRPNVVPGVSKKVSGSPSKRYNEWFNTAAFTQPDNYAFGTESRLDSELRSQGMDNFDMDLTKSVTIREGIKLQFRAEMFNLFNHPQFAPPNSAFGSSGFGRVTAQANQPRIGQFSLRLTY